MLSYIYQVKVIEKCYCLEKKSRCQFNERIRYKKIFVAIESARRRRYIEHIIIITRDLILVKIRYVYKNIYKIGDYSANECTL